MPGSMLHALLQAGRVPCWVLLEYKQGPERFAAPWQRVRTISPQITRSEPRGVLVSVRHFFPRTGNLLQILPIAKFSGCGPLVGQASGLPVPGASGSAILVASEPPANSSRNHLPSPISHPLDSSLSFLMFLSSFRAFCALSTLSLFRASCPLSLLSLFRASCTLSVLSLGRPPPSRVWWTRETN